MQSVTTKVSSLVENVKKFDIKSFSVKAKAYQYDWTQLGVSLVIGVLSGFLCKRYFRSLVLMTLFSGVLMYALEYYGIIVLDWGRVHTLTGVEPTQEAAISIAQECWSWIQMNKVVSAVCGVGFLIGVQLA